MSFPSLKDQQPPLLQEKRYSLASDDNQTQNVFVNPTAHDMSLNENLTLFNKCIPARTNMTKPLCQVIYLHLADAFIRSDLQMRIIEAIKINK